MTRPDRLLGARLVDVGGRDLGTISALLVDPEGLAARWLDVTLPSGAHAVVPAAAASADASGTLTVPYVLADLASAPTPDGVVLTADTATALLRHYGFTADDA